MRGRKPKPTEVKRLAGNPGKRPLNSREPELPAPDPGEPLPAELVGDVLALQEWARLEPMLRASKVLTAGDRGSLVALCQQWSRYLEATQQVAVLGLVITSPSGYPMTNPYIGIANKCLSMCVKLWTELGLTPSARSRVTISDTAPTDDFSEFDEPRSRMHVVKRRA